MQKFLACLEWLARYGVIDIVFGFGVIGLLASYIRKVFPSNYDQLHIDAVNGNPVSIPGAGDVQHSLLFRLRNSGQTNIFVTRCYFKTQLKPWYSLWLIPISTNTKVHPLSMRITHMNAYELKFTGNHPGFSNYETIIKPGNSAGENTFLALSELVKQEAFDKAECGTIYVEYATSGKRGLHVLRL